MSEDKKEEKPKKVAKPKLKAGPKEKVSEDTKEVPAAKVVKKKEEKTKKAPKQNLELNERRSSLIKLRGDINTEYKRKLFVQGQEKQKLGVSRLSTGSFWLDYALGGGFAAHRFHALWGDESTGKTMSALKTMADAQLRDRHTYEYIDMDLVKAEYELDLDAGIYVRKKDGHLIEPLRVALIDLEGTHDGGWFTSLGGNDDLLEYIDPDYGEQAVDISRGLISSGMIDVILIDSLAMLTPAVEVEKSAEDQDMGIQARLINKACRTWTMDMNKVDPIRRPTVLMINQLRHKIGVMFGNPETVVGGKGQKFITSSEVKTKSNRKVTSLDKDGKVPIWVEMAGIVNKNKTAPPKIEYKFNLAIGKYNMPPPLDSFSEEEVASMSEEEKKSISKAYKDRVYPCSFSKGDILEHKEVIQYASKFEMMGKDSNGLYFIQFIKDDRPILFDRKKDMLDEWIYNDPFKYNLVKQDLLKIMTGRA